MSEYFLDLKGLPCPLPLVKLKKALVTEPHESVFRVCATDRAILKDLPAFCQLQGLSCQIMVETSPYELRISRLQD